MPKDSKEGRDKLLYVESKKKKKRYKLTYLENRHRDIEHELMVTKEFIYILLLL